MRFQKVPQWSETVEEGMGSDSFFGCTCQKFLLGSSRLLPQKGLTESLAGRFEVHPLQHCLLTRCVRRSDGAYGESMYYGGYPGSALAHRDSNDGRTMSESLW
jgi:hypothetical protein